MSILKIQWCLLRKRRLDGLEIGDGVGFEDDEACAIIVVSDVLRGPDAVVVALQRRWLLVYVLTVPFALVVDVVEVERCGKLLFPPLPGRC